jgi:hypothetical protein
MSNIQHQLDALFNQSADLREGYDKFMTKVNKEANVLAREFDRKKQAFVSAKAGSTPSGKLDIDKLSEYKTNEDIFSRTRLLPQGKNHKFYVILDWSGSMHSMAQRAMEQTVIQAAFLRKLKIDHYITMFGYQGDQKFHGHYDENDDWVEADTSENKVGEVYDDYASVVELFTGSQSQAEYLVSAKLCYMISEYVTHRYGWGGSWFSLVEQTEFADVEWILRANTMGGTPLNISLAEMYNVMWREHAVDPSVQQNLLVISDGDSCTAKYHGNGYRTRDNIAHNSFSFEVDGKTKTYPTCILASGLPHSRHETYGMLSLFDWGVNKVFLFLAEKVSEWEIRHLVGDYIYRHGGVEDSLAKIRKGKILTVKNLYGCIDEVIYVPKAAKPDHVEELDELPEDNKGNISVSKFKTAMAKQAMGNPMQHLSVVIGEALAKNYSLNKHVKGSKQNARCASFSFDDKYWKNMANWIESEAAGENKEAV